MRFLVRKRRTALLMAAAAVAAVVLAGCDTDFTGGGQMPSASRGGGDANFGFVYHLRNDAGGGLFKGTYHDPGAGVKVRFDDSPFDVCGSVGGQSCNAFIEQFCNGNTSCLGFFQAVTGPCIWVYVNYVSQGKGAGPGTGRVFACDSGQNGSVKDDVLGIRLLTGPSAPYFNFGSPTAGNLTAH